MDNSEAKINQGVQIPIQTTSAAGTQTQLFNANLELKVTPQVTQDRNIFLDVDIKKDEPDFSRTGAGGDPTIVSRAAKTKVMVADGETTVIGGIYTRKTSNNVAGLPLLKDIPVLGWLFRKSEELDERGELLIFLTPRLVNREESMVKAQ
jgi:type IV pilus assembly protein PilQ